MMRSLVFSLSVLLAVCHVSFGDKVAEIDKESPEAGDVEKNGLVKRAAEPQCPNCRVQTRIGLNPISCPGCGRRYYDVNANINDKHHHYRHMCLGCHKDPSRFLDVTTNVNSNNQVHRRYGCPDGNCRMKRSADPGPDPQCPGGNCRRTYCSSGRCNNRRLLDLNLDSNHNHHRTWCPDCYGRFLDISTNVNSNNQVPKRFGCSDGNCRMKRSADPGPDPQCPGNVCRRNYCSGGRCNHRRLFDVNNNVNRYHNHLRTWCPDCYGRFLDISTNVNSNNQVPKRFGCSDGNCRMKRSADPGPDPQCPGGNCGQNYCSGGTCNNRRLFDFNLNRNHNHLRSWCPDCHRRFLDLNVNVNSNNQVPKRFGCPGGNCRQKRLADPQCLGGNCRRTVLTQCYGGSCRGGLKQCPGGNCGIYQCPGGNCGIYQCPGGNCVTNNRRCAGCDKHFHLIHHSSTNGRVTDCAGGNCRAKRSTAEPQDDMDNIVTHGR